MADEQGVKGRSRGRAKGRARPAAPTAGRPGEDPRPAAPPPAAHATGTGGRQTHRGVARAETVSRPGEAVADVTEQMGALSVQAAAQVPVAQAGRGIGRAEDIYTRPENRGTKKGDTGSQVMLLTNYFKLESRPTWCVHQYHVDFSPAVESSRMRRAMLGDHRETLGACYLFDGMSDLKSVVKLQQQVTELFSKRRTDDQTICIQVKYVNELAPNHPQLSQLFNTQMRRNLSHLKYMLIGRHYFDRNAVTEKQNLRLQIWQGIVTSIRMQERELLMLVDTVHRVIRSETAYEVINEIVKTRDRRASADLIAKELVGSVVMTRYNNRTYRVEEVCWDENPSCTFESKDGPISYLTYYQKQYDLKIKDVGQPLLLCTSKEREIRAGQSQSKKIMLIPELCFMTGLTERMRSNFSIMKEIASTTKVEPPQRVQNLQKFIDSVNSNPDVCREMNAWQLSFSGTPLSVAGRTFQPETIVQGTDEYSYEHSKADFTANVRSRPLHATKDLNTWILICPNAEREKSMDFIKSLVHVCRSMGINVNSPKMVCIRDDRISTFHEAFRDNYNKSLDIVVFVVPNNRKDRYDALKKMACIELPVPSQVIVSRTLSKRQMLMSVSTKIGIQINCKLGGEAWALKIPLKSPTMIIGYDTYHDSSKKGRSAGGFVASMNSTFTQWYSCVNFHMAGGWQELSNHLNINLTQALQRFQAINKCVPSLILFFRDGVGDGQIRYVLEWEVQQMEKCIADVLEGKPSYDPGEPLRTKYAFFVVNKRISTRFFARDNRNRIFNPLPGTVVDDVVTRYDRYDFFLVSQSVRQGTVAPTMYNIIKDTTSLRPDHMQQLAFKLTHLYYNWAGTIRVPAPCQYAHKLAFLTGQSLHQEPNESLQHKLFYL